MTEVCGADVQLIPVIARCKDVELEGVSIVNVLPLIDVIDREKSDLFLLKGTDAILKFISLLAKPSGLDHHQIGRDPAYRGLVFVSEALRERLPAEHVRGAEFRSAIGIEP